MEKEEVKELERRTRNLFFMVGYFYREYNFFMYFSQSMTFIAIFMKGQKFPEELLEFVKFLLKNYDFLLEKNIIIMEDFLYVIYFLCLKRGFLFYSYSCNKLNLYIIYIYVILFLFYKYVLMISDNHDFLLENNLYGLLKYTLTNMPTKFLPFAIKIIKLFSYLADPAFEELRNIIRRRFPKDKEEEKKVKCEDNFDI